MANDSDIFGASTGKVKDADIFGDVQDALRPEVKAASVEKPMPTYADRMKSVGTAALGGLKGGPLGALSEGTFEGMKQFGQVMEHVGYGAGEKVSDLAAKVLPPEGAAGLGLATNVAVQAVPMLLGGEAAKVVTPAFQAGAKSLMQSALKPTWEAIRTGKASRAIDTMLEEGINPTVGGIEKLRPMIDKLETEVSEAIANSTATVNKAAVGARLRETWDKFKSQVNPQADLDAIRVAWDKFKNHPDLVGKTEIPVQTAQEMKRRTYQILADKYGEEGAAATEAQKALARGLKEDISAAVPSVAVPNAKASDLLNVLGVAERRAYMDLNKNPMSLALLAHNPAGFAAFMADKSALFKSLVARMMHSGAERIPETAGRAGVGILNSQNAQPPRGVLMEQQ